MTISYNCEKCLKLFAKKSSFISHQKRKTPCNILCNKFLCTLCNKKFSTQSNLTKHIKLNCKSIINKIRKSRITKDEIYTKRLELLISEIKTSNCKNINNITNNNNNITNNIQINAFNIDKNSKSLQISDYTKIFGRYLKCIQSYIEHVHCNPDKPENNNIYISNIVNDYIQIYDGQNWKMEDRTTIINEMINDISELLENAFDDYKDQLHSNTINSFNKFINVTSDRKSKKYETFLQHTTKDVILILYNYRTNITKQKKPKKINKILNTNVDKLIKLPTNNILIELPTNDISIELPTNDILVELPTNDILIELPTNDILIELPDDDTLSNLSDDDISSNSSYDDI